MVRTRGTEGWSGMEDRTPPNDPREHHPSTAAAAAPPPPLRPTETTQQFTLTMEKERIEGSKRMLQSSKRFKDVKDKFVKVFLLVAQVIGNIVLRLLWHFLHLIISFWHVLRSTIVVLQSYLISSGLLKKYKVLDLSNLQYLAIVVENEEVHDISRVIKLVQWLSQIGVKHVCLYDMHGVLKESKKVILQNFSDARLREPESDLNDILLDRNQMTLEFASFSDGKAGITKAANLLCSKYLKIASSGGDWSEPVFTELDMSSALRAVGCEWPEPNLLLTYGSVRCHLGFPAWRMRYTEIVHMGPLKSMKYGALVKVIEEFTRVKQNYGT